MELNHSLYRKRIRLIMMTALFLWVFFLGRFFYLQIISHEELAEAAAVQHQIRIDGLDSRGMILDRNLQPLTGGMMKYYYFLPKEKMNPSAESLLHAVSASEISSGSGNNSSYEVWRTEMYDENISRKLKRVYGAYVLRLPSRYSSLQTACHLTGYLNEADQTGAAGLEKAFEDRLQSSGSRIALKADGSGRILAAAPPDVVKKSSLRDSSLVTTLDRGLQKLCELAMSERNLTGAVLVSDAETGEILAWVSSPYFNPNALEQHIESGGDELVNKCIQGNYPPGSVFKIVLAAAALESSTENLEEEYLCTGETVAAGVTLGCRNGPEGGHGTVNLERAMSVSCNCYFAHLGEKVGRQKLLEMAHRLGFGNTVMEIFEEESPGSLPSYEDTSREDISNLSIGQGALLVTPVQVHQMMSAAAADGMMIPLTVVYASGERPAKRVFSPAVSSQLTDMLEQVMETGTGAAGSWPCPVYGKTGTAEAAEDGRKVNRCWFSGFCRADEKTFVVTVLTEEGESGSAACLPVFQDITEYLAGGKYRQP